MTADDRRAVQASKRPPMWLLFALTATGITSTTLVASSLPEILVGVGGTQAQAGLVIAAATMPGILLSPLMGILADRHGRREVLVPCLVLFGLSGGLAALSTSVGMLTVLRFFQGAGSSGLISLAIVMIGDNWEGASRTRIIGRNTAVLTVSLSVYPTIGGVLTDVAGWRAPFLVYFLALGTAWLVARRVPPTPPRERKLREQLGASLPTVRQPIVLACLGGTTTTFAMIFGLMLTVLPIYLEASFGLPASVRGIVLGLPAVTNTLVNLLLGRLQRFPKRRQLYAATALLLTGTVTLALAPMVAVVAAGVLCFGAGEGLMISNLQDSVAASGDARSRGAIVTLFTGAGRVGQTVGPLLAGAALPAFGAAAVLSGGGVLGAAVLLPLVTFGFRRPPVASSASGGC